MEKLKVIGESYQHRCMNVLLKFHKFQNILNGQQNLANGITNMYTFPNWTQGCIESLIRSITKEDTVSGA